ncbi:MAG: hypothetical protein HY721_09285 [Planctomycetes bacterium]|nr:hypothetical protein [Planctomycetota bacterium]
MNHFLSSYEFRGGRAPECLEAGDANADFKVNVADPIWILNYLYTNGPVMDAPFPEPGQSPYGGVCEAYGGGSPLEDPAAEMAVLDAVAAGGAEPRVAITVAVSSSAALGGYAGDVRLGGGLGGWIGEPGDLSGSLDPEDGFLEAGGPPGRVRFGFLASLVRDHTLPPGRGVRVLEVTLCLAKTRSSPPGRSRSPASPGRPSRRSGRPRRSSPGPA